MSDEQKSIPHSHKFSDVSYSPDIERVVRQLEKKVKQELNTQDLASARVVAKWLLEGDLKAAELASKEEIPPSLKQLASKLRNEIEWKYGEKTETRISKERYALAGEIAKKVTTEQTTKPSIIDKLDSLTLSYYTGIPILALVVVGIFAFLFYGGGFLEDTISGIFTNYIIPFVQNVLGYTAFTNYTQLLNLYINPNYTPFVQLVLQQIYPYPYLVNDLFINGAVTGVEAVFSIAIPYILTFYIILALLEDTGYLTRIAFLLDNVMHKFGLHGRSIIPLMASLGCNVPAILGTRILESRKQRLIATFLIVLVPCSARISVILGSVAYYVGIQYALIVFAIIFGVVAVIGVALAKILPGSSPALVMEMPPYQIPSLGAILKKTWYRLKEFIYIALPIIVVGSIILGALTFTNIIYAIIQPAAPFMANWLGLPSITSITLIYGVLRKEATIQSLLVISQLTIGINNLGIILTPIQMIIYATVVALYFPCVASFSVLTKELGLRWAATVAVTTIALAILIGGIIWHIYLFLTPGISFSQVWLYYINYLTSMKVI
jgi:ferrous iron transport protein B